MRFLVNNIVWSGEHRAFVVEEFIKNYGSLITTQRSFRIRLTLGQRDPVQDTKKIKNWISNFQKTGNLLKRKSYWQPRTVTGLENVTPVRASVAQSSRCSAPKHGVALQISDRSVRRILHRVANASP